MNSPIDKLTAVQADITQLQIDAIVNAANTSLLGGGGVDGAIHRKAGPDLLKECYGLGGCETGQSKLTKGYALPAKYIIHTVGPIWHGGEAKEKQLLTSCYQTALSMASEQENINSIAFPAISCGIYGYPIPEACEIAVSTTLAYLAEDNRLEQVVFVAFDDTIFQQYQDIIKKYSNEI